MKILIDTVHSGKTVEIELEDMSSYPVPLRLSTARSLEAGALREAKDLLWELRSYALRQQPMPEKLRDRLSVILDKE